MSEAELHMITSRLQGAKRAAAERGELRFPLPVGYVHDEDGQTIIDPDEEVAGRDRRCVRRVRADRLGLWRGRRVQGPAVPEARLWRGVGGRAAVGRADAPAGRSACSPNPCYAGAYVFGRYRSGAGSGRTARSSTRRRAAARRVAGADPDHHPGYITWETYLANEQRLPANDTPPGQRPPREGAALCQGIVRCGACGRSMTTLLPARGRLLRMPVTRARTTSTTPGCRSVKTAVVDELVARRLLAALAPEEIALALAAADEVADRRARSTRAVELRVERARYEAARAERAFHACEPENRLVARSLETRWETQATRARRSRGRARRADRARRRSPRASSSRRSRATCPRCGPPTAPPRRTASGCCAR